MEMKDVLCVFDDDSVVQFQLTPQPAVQFQLTPQQALMICGSSPCSLA